MNKKQFIEKLAEIREFQKKAYEIEPDTHDWENYQTDLYDKKYAFVGTVMKGCDDDILNNVANHFERFLKLILTPKEFKTYWNIPVEVEE